MRTHTLIAAAVVVALGCGGGGPGQKVASVSGTVTLNGSPLANATVSFQPIAKEKTAEAGVGSTGKTNDKGEYTLTLMSGKQGAVVGKHRVLITVLAVKAADDDSDSRVKRGGPPLENKIPSRYDLGEPDELGFEVPSSGTNKADFKLTSP